MRRTMKDRRGEFTVDQSHMRDVTGAISASVEFLPFDPGDARIMSVPAHDFFVTAAGRDGSVDRGILAMRVGSTAVHHQFDVAGLRMLSETLLQMARVIEAGA